MRKPSDYRIKASLSLSLLLRAKLVALADFYECTESKVVSTLLEQAFNPPGFAEFAKELDEKLSNGFTFEEILLEAGHRKISRTLQDAPK